MVAGIHCAVLLVVYAQQGLENLKSQLPVDGNFQKQFLMQNGGWLLNYESEKSQTVGCVHGRSALSLFSHFCYHNSTF